MVALKGVLPKGGMVPVRYRLDPYSSINDNAESADSALWNYLVNGGGSWFLLTQVALTWGILWNPVSLRLCNRT